MFASYAGIVVFTIIALIFPLTPLLAARIARAQSLTPDAPTARRRGIGALWQSDAATVERFLRILVWITVGIQVLLLVPWVVAFDALTLTTLVELGIALVVLLVGVIFAWRRGLWRRSRSAVTATEPTEA